MKDLKDLFIGMNMKPKIQPRNLENNNFTRFYLDTSFQGVKRLFVLVFDNTDDGANKVERNSQRKE